MKIKNIGFWAIAAVMANLLAAPVANSQTERFSARLTGAQEVPPINTAGQGAQGGRLQGTWDTQVSIIDCQTGNVITTFQSLIVFMAGGTLTESTSGTAPALRTPGEGVWRHTTDNNYAFRFKHFRFNAQNVLTGWNIIQAEASLDAAGNAYTSSATIEVYDPNGVLIATACATTAGTRFEL